MSDSATILKLRIVCRIVRGVAAAHTWLYFEVVGHWQEADKVADQAVGNVPVSGLHSLVRDILRTSPTPKRPLAATGARRCKWCQRSVTAKTIRDRGNRMQKAANRILSACECADVLDGLNDR